MSEQERRVNAEIERDIANDVAVGESVKRDLAEHQANVESVRRSVAEQRAFVAEVEADDAQRMTQNVAASSAMAYDAARSAERSSFATGVIALFVVVGLLLGGLVLYNNYKVKNDQLYSANIQAERHKTENKVLQDTATREALRADAAQQAAAAAAVQPTPEVHIKVVAPTPAPPPPPADVNVIVPPATPAPDMATPAPSTGNTTESTTTTNADGSTTVTVTH